jgi:hypothetical protein
VNVEVDLSWRISVLRKEYLFQGLEPAQLSRVAGKFEPTSAQAGELIFAQGDAPDFFYIVLEGQVRVFVQVGYRERDLNNLGPGDYFGEQALLFNTPRSASVSAISPVILLRLSQEQFQDLLTEYPQIGMNLSATAQSRKLVRRLQLPWLAADEVIYFITRKHWLFLVISLAWPVVTTALAMILWALFVLKSGTAGLPTSALMLAIPLLVILLWGGWNWLDWGNDYYIVTNQRVVWQEKIILLYDSRQEAPLNSVIAVNTNTLWLGRVLDYGDVEVRTFTGTIPMKKMAKPYMFASFVEGYKKRFQAISREREEHEIEEMLRKALVKSMAPPEAPAPADAAPAQPDMPTFGPAPKKKQETFLDDLRNALQTFLKVRYQEGKVITYRKHWMLLLGQAGLPFLIHSAMWLGFIWALVARQYLFVLLLVLPLIITFFWVGYQYMDWSNDIYRLTPEQIMDIEKKPLGREDKKTANLDAPDFRVEHIRANIVNILLNYGDVIVNVGQTKFTFDGVYNPDQVHQDVANYREDLQRRKREEESKRERDRMVNWLVAYHNQTEKLEKPENKVSS